MFLGVFFDRELSRSLLSTWCVYGRVIRIKFNKEIRGRGSERRESQRGTD